jgi:hypothetical protein
MKATWHAVLRIPLMLANVGNPIANTKIGALM